MCNSHNFKKQSLNKRSLRKKNKGFTLLEILVALAVVSVTLIGVVKVTGQAATQTQLMTEQMFANWVAANQMAKLHITETFQKTGQSKGDDEMANMNWTWVQTTTTTDVKEIHRVEIEVWKEGNENSSAKLVGFSANPNP